MLKYLRKVLITLLTHDLLMAFCPQRYCVCKGYLSVTGVILRISSILYQVTIYFSVVL